MSFFAVLVRFGVVFAVLPVIGDRNVPGPLKILFAVSVTIALFPTLLKTGQIKPGNAATWASSPSGIASTVGFEALVGLALGYVAKMSFETINFGSNLVGNFMGFASASTYDPHQESQTQVVAEIQMAIAMLLFLAIDGHHLMLRAALESYRVVGLGGAMAVGKAGFGAAFGARIVEMSGEVIKFGILLASPVAVSLFAVNVAFGVLAKAMPQLNILVLSFAVTALVGLIVMLISIPEFQGVTEIILGKMSEWMEKIALAIGTGR